MLPRSSHSSGKYITQAGHHYGDQFNDLNGARCAAQNVSDLEILQEFARDGGGNAHHRGYRQHRYHATGSGDSQRDHEERGDDQGGERQAGDGIVGRADTAHQISGDGSEEESDDQHHQGRRDGAADHVPTYRCRARTSIRK
jgi:hypothetical protein